MTQQEQEDLMVRAAWMYYYDDMTHQEIADKLGLSRIKVTRLLQAARQRGIVEIKVTRPLPVNFELSHQLEQIFGLRDAIVVNTLPSLDNTLNEIARAGAEYLARTAQPSGIIGFGWSSTVSRMAAHLDLLAGLEGTQIVDLVGSMLGKDMPYSVSAKVADRLRVPLAALSVPVILQNDLAYQAIIEDPNIKNTLQIARRANVGIFGVGDLGPQNALVSGGYVSKTELQLLRARGAVGDIIMRFYDLVGQRIELDIDSRIVGLTWDELRAIPLTIVMAAGPTKAAPIVGILRSGLCQTLITDLITARAVIDLHQAG